MRSLMLAAALMVLPASAFARCQCVCVGGQMRSVCTANEVVAPICQGLCGMAIQPDRVATPLAGGPASANAIQEMQGQTGTPDSMPPQRP